MGILVFIIMIILMVAIMDLEKMRKQNDKVIKLNEELVKQNETIISLLEGKKD